MLQESIQQYFRPSFSYNLSLRALFCLFWVATEDSFYCKSGSLGLFIDYMDYKDNDIEAGAKLNFLLHPHEQSHWNLVCSFPF